jgi:hypothetical protein
MLGNKMPQFNVQSRWLGGTENRSCFLPKDLANITLYSTIDEQTKNINLIIEAIGAEIMANPLISDLLFSEGLPVEIEFEKYSVTDLFERLTEKFGYKVQRTIGTFFGITAITPASRPASDSRCYTLVDGGAGNKKSLPVTQEMIDGYRGMGLIVVPIPSDVILSRIGIGNN